MNEKSDTSDMNEDIQKNAEEGQLPQEENAKGSSPGLSQSENKDTSSKEAGKEMDYSSGEESDEDLGTRRKKRAQILSDSSDDENDESLRNSILAPVENHEELSNDKSSEQSDTAGNEDSNEEEKVDKSEALQDEDSNSNSEDSANIEKSKKKTKTGKESLTEELEENHELIESRDEEIGLAKKKKRVQILSDNSDDENDITMKSSILAPGENLEEPSNDKSSDQNNESDGSADITEARYRKLKFLCDDDSSEEENNKEETEDNQLQSLPDEDSLSISGNVEDIGKSKKKKKTKSTKKERRTEISDENNELSENSDEEFSEEVQKKGKRKSKKPDKPKKPSKKERDEVFSMMQRNAREETIEIPYNKPEQYDLKEFLSRLQQNKVELPIDKKLAKKTGKLGALKREKIVPDEDLVKTNEIQEVHQIDQIQKPEIAKEDQLSEQLTESESIADKDEIDQLVAGTSKETALEPLEPIQIPKDENNVKRLILHGDPNSVIDLESGLVVPKTKSKEVLLIEKCLSQNAKPHGVAKPEIKVENSPGVAYKNLMESLSKELLRKKREQMQKYIEEQEKSKIVNMANNIDDEAEFASDFDEDENEKDDEDNNDGEDGKEDLCNENSELREDNELNEDETEEHDKNEVNEEESEDENEANDEDSDSEDQSSERKKKLRKRIVVMDGEDSDDEQLKDDHGEEMVLPMIPNENILLPSLEHNTSVTESQMEKDEMELFNLCTGNFETQAPPQSINLSDTGLDKSIEECAKTHEVENEISAVPNFESSDEEKTSQGVPVKKKCRKPRVYLSDDEEPQQKDDEEFSKETEDRHQESEEESSKEAEHEELSEVAEISDQEECEDAENIAYDSEENEIDTTAVSALPTKPKIKVSDFMESEAELSESEWGSADEDERDLNKFEAELGDEDQFDQAQLQSELERIHMKKLLDQDAREVKMVKNLVLHEEEREGMTRERTFRWLHVDNDFNLNGDNQDNQLDETRESDDENEEEWRKIRHERNVMLKEKLQGGLTNLFETKNVTILKPSIPEHPKEVKAPTFLVPDREILNKKSLLLQDEEYLARLAALTSKTSDTLVNGATEKGSFVFRQLARQEEDPEPSAGKRKPENALAPVKGKKRKKTSIYG
ncbi:claspin [Phlebotomus papatasi]|uniref:claspin n=1 Tax=Phlebotomus papatasi TaxID=29031 RepID=UPI0024841B40|nr:claspin [Phlebotomus papatasi]